MLVICSNLYVYDQHFDCSVGGLEGLLMAKLLFTEADLLYLLRVCAMDAIFAPDGSRFLRVCRTVPCRRFALLRLALRPRRIILEGGMTPREDGGRALMARRKIC